MEPGTIILTLVILFSIFYLIKIYNHLVRIKHNVSKAWSNIDVLLKQRHEEIPKLVEICKQYMKFDKDTLDKVMQARNLVSAALLSQDMQSLGAAEELLRMGLAKLFVDAGAYPELTSDDKYKHLKNRVSSMQSATSDRTEIFNESVTINNTRIEQFPYIILARLMDLKLRDLLQFSS